jgi:hypothetical protein
VCVTWDSSQTVEMSFLGVMVTTSMVLGERDDVGHVHVSVL